MLFDDNVLLLALSIMDVLDWSQLAFTDLPTGATVVWLTPRSFIPSTESRGLCSSAQEDGKCRTSHRTFKLIVSSRRSFHALDSDGKLWVWGTLCLL